MIIPIPTDRPTFDSPTSVSWIDDHGFLVSVTKPIPRTFELTVESMDKIKNLVQSKKVYGLVETTKMSSNDKKTRDYMSQKLPLIYHAMAVVAANPVGVILAKMFIAINKQPIPTQLFSGIAIYSPSPFYRFIGSIALALSDSKFPKKTFSNLEDAKKWIKNLK